MATSIDNCKNLTVPAAADYLANLEIEYLVLTVCAGFIILVTTIMYFSEVVFIYSRRENWPQPGKTMWLLGLYSVFGWTAFVGIIVPRSGDLGSMIATMYLSTCLWIFKRLMVCYYGGHKQMNERLKDSKFILRSPPCCCCCFCLPTVEVSPKMFLVIEILVLQFTIMQPILVFIEAVFIADSQGNVNNTITVATSSIGTVSSLFALYGLFLFFRVSLAHIAYASIKAKFICLKLIIGIDSLQKLILSILATSGVIPCSSMLSPKDNAIRISRYLVVFEAFLVSLIARVYYKRDQNLHLHPALNRNPSSYSDENEPLVESGSTDELSGKESTLVGSVDPSYGSLTNTVNENNGGRGTNEDQANLVTT